MSSDEEDAGGRGSARAAKTLVVGVGNVLLGDEGLGVHVARALASRAAELPPGLEVIEAGTALFDLEAQLIGASRIVLVDAMRGGGAPGTVYRIDDLDDLEGLEPARVPLSLHEWSAVAMLASLRMMGVALPRLSVIGAEPDRIAPGLELSSAAAQAAERIVALLIAEGSP